MGFDERVRGEVVITGVGMVTPLGATAVESGRAWAAGAHARRRCLAEFRGTPLEHAEVAPAPDVDPADKLGGKRMLKFMSSAAVLGCLAAREAVAKGKVQERFAAERVGLFAATGLTAARLAEVEPLVRASLDEGGRFSTRRLGEQGLAAANPLLSFRLLANIPPCLISIMERIKGPSLVFNHWEGQGGAALVEAWSAVASGEVDAAVAGAADNPTEPSTVLALSQAGLLRAGEAPAAAAAYLILERLDTAREHGLVPLARISTMSLEMCESGVRDPLAARLGRTFAAAPALAVGLAAWSLAAEHQWVAQGEVVGVDRQRYHFALEAI